MKNKLFILVIIGVVLLLGASTMLGDKKDTPSSVTEPPLKLSDIHGLEVAIDNPDKIYLPNHQGLYSQESDGALRKEGSISDDFMSFALSPNDPLVFYASGHPKTGGNFGLIKTTDGANSWKSISEGLDGPVDFHTMAIDSNNDALLYGYYSGALQRSTDGGITWQYLNNAPEQIIQLSSGAKEGQLYAATVSGLQVSEDRGDSWNSVAAIEETVIAIEVNVSSGQMFAYGATSGLLTSDDNGETWVKVDLGSITGQIVYIAASKTDPKRVYFVTKSLELYESTDSGTTWNQR